MTASALAPARRLPGFAFEAQVPVYDDVLPRMDVAVFAGFAASGPVNLPVPVEDPAQFEAIFGTDAPLAWDESLGHMTYAQLAPAVRMFFSNGGRRCWVVRLAGSAHTNKFAVPGVAVLSGASPALIEQLTLDARSPGSWSDGVQLSASLTTQRFGVIEWGADSGVLAGPLQAPLQPGDLLQVTWSDAGVEGYIEVKAVTSTTAGRERHRNDQKVIFGAEAWFDTATTKEADEAAVEIDAENETIRPGSVVVRNDGGREMIVVVREVLSSTQDNSLSSPALSSPPLSSPAMPGPVKVRARRLWRRAAPPVSSPDQQPTVTRVAIDLWARVGEGRPQHVSNLGLAPSSARHIGTLPDDVAMYDPIGSLDKPLWQDVVSPRFPVSGSGNAQLCIPLGVTALPEFYLGIGKPAAVALVRDGLANFSASLFADESLAGSLATSLLEDAEYVRFLDPHPSTAKDASRLKGLHAALPIEEATIISIPDATQPGWIEVDTTQQLPEPLPPSVAPPAPCPKDDFDDCIAPTSAPAPVATAKRPGNKTEPAKRWRIRTPKEYDDSVLVAVHRLMLRLCAARRDVIAVLSLPRHYDEVAAAAHARMLASPSTPTIWVGNAGVAPISTGEGDAVGFGAMYHGWSIIRADDGALRAIPPDGLVCGVIARRAAERGAWVAPANELLRGLIALERPAPPERWRDIQQLNINLLRRDPRGFVVMSADTLSPDADVRPINVRRLLIVLRRVATRWGATYVFEPNDESFRRFVQRGFEELLGDMFQRGAFAGSTAATAYQVVTGESLNTPSSADVGRFIVELRVAPPRPMVFLTLRLVQTGDRLTVTGA